jgi:hypothetical protein
MKRFICSFSFLFVLLGVGHAQETNGTSTVTLGVGGGWPIRGNGVTGGPQFNGTYEYRLRKYLALEFGVDTTVVTVPATSVTVTPAGSCIPLDPTAGCNLYAFSNSFYSAGGRAVSMPFGFRGIRPILNGRVELFIGGGGVYLWNPRSYYSQENGWGLQATMGARVAVDKQRHFWLGTTGRFMNVNRVYPSQWISWTADVGFRFGR